MDNWNFIALSSYGIYEVIGMIWLVILALMAAFGIWCAAFLLFGWLFSEDDRAIMICLLPEDRFPDGIITRFRWLREMGLVRPPLLIVSQPIQPEQPDVEYCSLQDLPARLELERNKLD